MAIYPSPPNFSVPGPDASDPNGWWGYTRQDGTLNICAADGAAVLRRARGALLLSGTPVWDADLQAALVTRAQLLSNAQPSAGWQQLIAELQSGLSQQQPSPNAMKFVIWVGYYQANGLRLDAISLDGAAVLPQWGAVVQDGPAGDAMACFDPNRDAPVYSEFSAAQQDSSAGIRLHAGESLPSPVAPVPPPGPSGLPAWALLLIGAAVIGAVGVVVFTNTKFTKEEETRRSSVPVPRSRRVPHSSRLSA